MRQYVGERYVPKLFDNNGDSAWIANMSYEPLTIVTYLNSSYTSKKPVPAGIGNPAQNPDYWVLTGNFNGQVADYHEIVQEALDSIDGNIGNNIYDTNYHILCIGDSYFTGTQVSQYETPVTQIASYFKKTIGVNLFNASKGGAGFLGFNDNYILEVIKAYIAGGNIPDNNKIKICLIGLGYNDLVILKSNTSITTSEISKKLSDVFYYLRITFPKAKIMTTFTSAGYANVDSDVKALLQRYYFYETIGGWGYYLGNSGNILKIGNNSQLLASDKIHPTNYGAIKLGQYISNMIMGKNELFYQWGRSDNRAYVSGETIHIKYKTFYKELNIPYQDNLDGENLLENFDLNLSLIGNGVIVAECYTNVVMRIDNTTYSFPAKLKVKNSALEVYPIAILNSNYVKINQVRSVKVLAGEMTGNLSVI